MASRSSKILVIGCVSRDLIHLEKSSISIHPVGGAGLYTALAARATGADCTLLAPRPHNYNSLGVNHEFPFDWIGPQASEENFPHLEIKHHGNDHATLCGASWGAESLLNPDCLPEDLSDYSIIHIAALSSARRQLDFLNEIRNRSHCKISIGTYARLAYSETTKVRELLKLSNFCFMNANEAKAIFDKEAFPLQASAEQIISVTRGSQGACIYSRDSMVSLPGMSVQEYDPTGAGDTFAGTLLGMLAQNQTLQASAELAVQRSALVITKAGPSAILSLVAT